MILGNTFENCLNFSLSFNLNVEGQSLSKIYIIPKMTDYSEVKLSPKIAESLILGLYNIEGKAMALPGESDFNFKIITKERSCFLLKVSRPNENGGYFDFHQKILQHIEVQKKNIVVSQSST